MLNDFCLATRALLKTPLFTLAALAALALAIGANAAVFGLVNQLLLRPAGIVDPERVVAVLGKGTIYYSLFQEAVPFATIVVRSRADAGLLARAIPLAVAAVDAAQPVFDVRSLEEDISRSLAPQRFVVQLLMFFAAAALFMASLGLYAPSSTDGMRPRFGGPIGNVR